MRGNARALARSVLLALIWFYQRFASPVLAVLFAGSCRFTPSCSEYARQAVLLHGPARGTLLALWRLSRCHPYCRGGHDPVPLRFSRNLSPTHASEHTWTANA